MNHILSNWTLMRILRLVTGGMVLGQGILTSQWLFAGVGGYLFVMSLLNIGGCSSGVCGVQPFSRSVDQKKAEVEFEDIGPSPQAP